MSEDAAQPIDPIYTESLKSMSEATARFKNFIDTLDEKNLAAQQAYEQLLSEKNQADSVLKIIRDAEATYTTAKQNAEAAKSLMESQAQSVEQALSRVQDAERIISEQKAKIDSDTQTVEATKVRYDDLKAEADRLSAELTSKHTDIDKTLAKANEKLEEFRTIDEEIASFKTQAESSKDAISANLSEIETQKNQFQESLDSTNQILENLKTAQEESGEKITEIENKYSEINAAYDKLLIGSKDASGSITKSVSAEFDELLAKAREISTDMKASFDLRSEAFATLYNQQSESFDKLYEELNKKINSLLPGAGAAGLSSSYFQAKMRYTTSNDITLHDDADDITNRMKLKKADFIPQWAAYAFNLILFLAPLLLLFFTFEDFKYPSFLNSQPFAVLFYKLILTLPLVAISTYGIVSLVSDKKLYEAYNHKQRVMQLYHSFKEEIDKTGDTALKAKLLEVMLDVVKDKPDYKPNKSDRALTKMIDVLKNPIDKISEKLLGE